MFPLESAFSSFDESFLSFPSDFAETFSNFFLASSLNPIVNSLLLRLTLTSSEPVTLSVSSFKFKVSVVSPLLIFNVDALLASSSLVAYLSFALASKLSNLASLVFNVSLNPISTLVPEAFVTMSPFPLIANVIPPLLFKETSSVLLNSAAVAVSLSPVSLILFPATVLALFILSFKSLSSLFSVTAAFLILAVVTALSANFASVTAASLILAVVTALSANLVVPIPLSLTLIVIALLPAVVVIEL